MDVLYTSEFDAIFCVPRAASLHTDMDRMNRLGLAEITSMMHQV